MQFIVMLQYAALILSAILATGCQTAFKRMKFKNAGSTAHRRKPNLTP